MKALLAVSVGVSLIASLIATGPASAAPSGMNGVWKVHGTFAGVINFTATCTFKQVRAAFSGPCIDPANNTNKVATGTVSGGTVTFGYDVVFNNIPGHLTYTGQPQPDGTLKGTLDANGVKGVFTANR